jgi:hypothetical protein
MIKITHNSGFFSNCSIILEKIINFINRNHKLPDFVDTSATFNVYKEKGEGDVTRDYFHPITQSPNITFDTKILFHHDDQFKKYDSLNFNFIHPIVSSYFSPSSKVIQFIESLEKKYDIDYSNTCVLFYRGNDKKKETQICNLSEYIIRAKMILLINPNIKFLVQSDETEFLDAMKKEFINHVIFYDEIRHMRRCDSTVDYSMKNNIKYFSQLYLAITILMARCNYIICNSGNCSLWIMFFRRIGAKNIIQNLNGNWFYFLEDWKWGLLVKEGETVSNIPQNSFVRYGKNESWITVQMNTPFTATNETFSYDPCPGICKEVQMLSSK